MKITGIIEKIITNFEFDVFFVLILTSLSLSSLGIFLILKKITMIVDAMSHSILLGIVLSFLIVKNLDSPILILGATLIGIFTFYFINLLSKNKKIPEDASIGIVFTFFFSLAIIIISILIRDIHIDSDAVFLGNIELTHKKQILKIIPILFLNLFFVCLFYKELKFFIFDPSLFLILGFSSKIINYLLIFLVSLTVVVSFDIVGSVMVISSFIGPSAAAFLISTNLFKCFVLSLWISFINSSIGYFLGILFDLPVASLISFIHLINFFIVLILEPKKGFIIKIVKNYKQRKNFILITLLIHLSNHEKKIIIKELNKNLKWSSLILKKYLNKAFKEGYIKFEKEYIILTKKGKFFLKEIEKKFCLKINI
ncbi:metal ABC transporter permease ['Cynodon dactylon' phytoplasma]|uniref:metal ABC transporter permease n=1 Tax='Cynodon dactylon' phytoplasma TaxID=295320 RepID=UPI001265D58E|nr:metal ABC transporter permease ['Cynodon dactylon' phytoplasma]KAB8121824.1 metal ABC transporter permease ['Cynodon dactylon' phytoplasma]